MTGRKQTCFYCIAFALTALALFSYVVIRTKSSASRPLWENVESRCNIDYTPPESYGRLSPAWKLRPEFVWRADRCSTSLRLSEQQANHNSSYLIPRIIHQVWDSNDVPELYVKWTRSWLKVNPGWQHWFWTLSDVRNLVSRHYPAQLQTWDSYPKPIFRADAMRYFVLHRYGGVYVDLDYEALRPLDLWAQQYRCMFSEEPYEHAYTLVRRTSTFLSSAFIACSKGHPALLAVIDRINSAFERYRNDVMHATGPFMIDSALKDYAKRLQKRPSETQRCVDASFTVVPPYYFQPVRNQWSMMQARKDCNRPAPKPPRSAEVNAICVELRRTNFANQINPIAYAVHWWYGAWFQFAWKRSRLVNIFESVPGVKAAGQWASINETDFNLVDWCV